MLDVATLQASFSDNLSASHAVSGTAMRIAKEKASVGNTIFFDMGLSPSPSHSWGALHITGSHDAPENSEAQRYITFTIEI